MRCTDGSPSHVPHTCSLPHGKARRALFRACVLILQVHISDEYDSLCYMTDSSTNGTILRSASPAFRKSIVKGQDVLLSDGDSIEIPNVCIVTFKQTMRGVQLSEEVQRARREFALGEWQLSNRLLGSGSFATVLMAVSKKDIAKQIACKIIDRARIERLAAPTGSWHREVEVLRLISHVCMPTLNSKSCAADHYSQTPYMRNMFLWPNLSSLS